MDDKRPYTSSNTISFFGVVFGNKKKRKKYNFFSHVFCNSFISTSSLRYFYDKTIIDMFIGKNILFSQEWYQYLMCHCVLIKSIYLLLLTSFDMRRAAKLNLDFRSQLKIYLDVIIKCRTKVVCFF